ncbi:FepA family TonB-dependent siderophore receptor [Plastorhodobacter daqingensis]|uniref:FepA family TonB-dependent siderophore receptor n=1 Tax=Plastorhodobacter daqingensis TaxID=1387281 RepID=A0ABW2UL23_9RHOB
MPRSRVLSTSALALCLLAPQLGAQTVSDSPSGDNVIVLDEIVVLSAEQQLKQAPGVSVIEADDLARQPVTNDLSQIIRRMPGVNLTGASASGQRGNQRQIDIRGMGPENTLILIDGKPVLSRNAVRMGRAGERDSRGDTNWVPAELVERIEVLRGPAAARYGSGASGGVVNIITKRPETFFGSVGLFYSAPESSKEGETSRSNFMIGGPVGERLSFRLHGNLNRSEPDARDINAGVDDTTCSFDRNGTTVTTPCPAAGREGVVNRDLGALLTWEVAPGHEIDFEAGISRQSNIFTGDRQLEIINDVLDQLANSGAETNRMTRSTYALTHRGTYDFGESTSFLQWENTRNRRYLEGLAGGPEGSIISTEQGTITLDNVTAKTEWILPLAFRGMDQMLTLGSELRAEFMHDPVSLRQDITVGTIPGIDPVGANRSPYSDQWTLGLYAEDNIHVTPQLTVTPGLRLDHNSNFGANLSPSLNASYEITPEWSLKLGVARAFKAPNLFQLNPNYVYYTRGFGCPVGYTNTGLQTGCYVVGNPDLKPETSINKEIGLAYNGVNGVDAGLTYFHNDYKDRIASGMVPVGVTTGGTNFAQVFRWENVPEAVVSGLEGNLRLPMGDAFALTANATYMIKSEDKSNGQPLSLVPDYTVNASLDWYAREDVTVTASATHYGRTPSATLTATTGVALENPAPRPAYTIANLGVVYDFTETYRLTAGVTNVFDKRILREGSVASAGANTYNEAGRAFYLGVNATF